MKHKSYFFILLQQDTIGGVIRLYFVFDPAGPDLKEYINKTEVLFKALKTDKFYSSFVLQLFALNTLKSDKSTWFGNDAVRYWRDAGLSY